MREFIVRAIINKPVIVIERGGEILAELNNHYGIDTEREIKSCIADLKELYRKISVAAGGA